MHDLGKDGSDLLVNDSSISIREDLSVAARNRGAECLLLCAYGYEYVREIFL